jgi:hypothetical protein
MAAITIEIADDVAGHLADLVDLCNAANRERGGVTSHGELTVSKLMTMLAEDAAMVVSRPGSWEGSGMAEILEKHGYRI